MSGGKQSLGYSENLILFNDFAIERNGFERIRAKNRIKPTEDVHKVEAIYEPEFWENYNIILDVPLEKKIESDLTQVKNLKEQFGHNSKKLKERKRRKKKKAS